MIKKYPWHFVFLIFVICFLANIFQKMQWKESTDNVSWVETSEGLICESAPENSHIKKGDILFAINKYSIQNKIDYQRVIKGKKLCVYEIERDELIQKTDVEINFRYTPTSYYILVLSGIVLLLITLMFLNLNLKKGEEFTPPRKFFLLSLSFSGLMIFSPTGFYNFSDFVFLMLDRISYLAFPALLLNYSLYFPLRSSIFKKIRSKSLAIIIFIPPFLIFFLYLFFLFTNALTPIPIVLKEIIEYFRNISTLYFAIYSLAALFFFINSSQRLIKEKRFRRFYLPLIGIVTGIPIMIVFNIPGFLSNYTTILNIFLFGLLSLPVSLTYFLSYKKFNDIDNIVKKTIFISLVLFFIFGIFLFLGFNIEKNKIIGIFWSIIAIITAGLLFKPIESTLQEYFERFFLKGTFRFKKKLMELIQSFRSERDLQSLAENLLETLEKGFHLKKCLLFIPFKKRIFHSYPDKRKNIFSSHFINELTNTKNLIFPSPDEFSKKFLKEYKALKDNEFFQFLPLKTEGKLVGFIAFSLTNNGNFLTLEDWELLHSIVSPLTLSIENASLYSQLENQFKDINLLKEFHENVIENINMGMVVLTNLNIIKTWNRFMELKFNVTAKKALNRKAFQIFGNDLWKQIYPRKNRQSTLPNVNITIKDEELIFNIHISPLIEFQGRTIGTILVFEDVTENIQMQHQLITSEKMASIGLLSAGIAHEVNTPLTGISSYCQLILSEPDNPENMNLISKMQDQVERANKIIRTLLDFSRQQGENPQELNIDRIINESIPLIEHNLKKKNIKLTIKAETGLKITGFPTRLQQLVINLMINAIDSIDHAKGRIELKGIKENGTIVLTLKDNGKGIDLKHKRKIFEPFFTTKDKGEGTGLGLSIIYNIVEEHYGKISFESTPGNGSTFKIILPLVSPLRSIKI